MENPPKDDADNSYDASKSGRRRRRGRPINTPDVWTPEHIAEVADNLWQYIERTACPSIPEFCYKHLVWRRYLYDVPELSELRELLHAKRAAYFDKSGRTLTREDGPRGAYIIRAAANVGDFSMVERTEVESTVKKTTTHVYLPDNGRGDGPKLEGTNGQ